WLVGLEIEHRAQLVEEVGKVGRTVAVVLEVFGGPERPHGNRMLDRRAYPLVHIGGVAHDRAAVGKGALHGGHVLGAGLLEVARAELHQRTDLLRPADAAADLVTCRPGAVADGAASGELHLRDALAHHALDREAPELADPELIHAGSVAGS